MKRTWRSVLRGRVSGAEGLWVVGGGDENGVEDEGGFAVEEGVLDAGEEELKGHAAAGFGAEVDGGGAGVESGEEGLFVVAGNEVEIGGGVEAFAAAGGVGEGGHEVGGEEEAGGAMGFLGFGEIADEGAHGGAGIGGGGRWRFVGGSF